MRTRHDTSTLILAEHAGFARQIFYLAWMDLQKSYRGALLGWLWVLVRPLIMLDFYWFIIAIGLQSDTIAGANYSYLSWLIVGLCAWFFISDMINAGVGAFRKYKFLIAKTKFPVATIPTIVTISNFMVHAILLTVVLLYLAITGHASLQWVQLPVYVGLSFAFMWAWSLFASTLGAVSKDFTQFVKSMMRILVWVSGILWSVQNVSIGWLREIMLLNPICYLAEGYRKSLIYQEWFFKDWYGLVIFLGELTILAAFATVLFKRSRRELADVL